MSGYILVVDDDTGLREALVCELEARGHKVRSAADGAEGLACLRAELPMVVVTDLEMPVMNGRKMLQLLRSEPLGPDVPVIVLSGFGFEWEAELMGAQAFLRKPVQVDHLEETMSRVLASATEVARQALH
jgi:CheY-like chemotaxis protein